MEMTDLLEEFMGETTARVAVIAFTGGVVFGGLVGVLLLAFMK